MSKALLFIASKPHLANAILSLVVLLIYINTLSFGFVWDDHTFILENDSIRRLSNIGRFFTDPKTTFAQAVPGEEMAVVWRPLRNISFALDYAISGFHPAWWHLHNVILHALCACVIYLWTRLLLRVVVGNARAAAPPYTFVPFFAALFWAAHPALAEVAAYVKGRDDQLALFFILISFIWFVKAFARLRFSPGAYILAQLFFVLSLLSKESGFPLIAMFILFTAVQVKPAWRRHRTAFILSSVGLFVTFAIYMILRTRLIGTVGQWHYLTGTLPKMILAMIPAIARYIYLSIWPFPPNHLIADYDQFPLIKTFTPQLMVYALLLLALLYNWAILGLRNRMIAWGLLLYFIALFPVSNIVPTLQLMAERFLYLPQVGLALSLASLVIFARQKSRILNLTLAGFVIYAIALATSASHRSLVFQNDMALFKSSYGANPYGTRPAINYAGALLQSSTDTTATTELAARIVHRLPPGYDRMVLMGRVELRRGNLDKSRQLFIAAIAANPDALDARHMKANVELSLQSYRQALNDLQWIIDRRLDTPQTWSYVALAQIQLGNLPEARVAVENLKLQDLAHPALPALEALLGNSRNPEPTKDE